LLGLARSGPNGQVLRWYLSSFQIATAYIHKYCIKRE
jgi:hypothetical protein